MAEVTDVGYTAAFSYAAAVVTELGGPMSHAAVVAREFGFPCVVDVAGATRRLPPGRSSRSTAAPVRSGYSSSVHYPNNDR